MSILIQINPSLEDTLREKASRKGLGVNQFISQFLEQSFSSSIASHPVVSEREAALLQQINLNISVEDWALYQKLKQKREKGLISPSENEQLIALTNAVETANAQRIAVLAELSQIRNVPIRTLMEQLGL